MPDNQTFTGIVVPGFQFASGGAVGRAERPSPFPAAGTLAMQHPHFKARGFDLEREIPGMVWATINVRIDQEVILDHSDRTLELVDWTRGTSSIQIAPETFSFARCNLVHREQHYRGMIYYPRPETKPATNDHDYRVIEVLTSRVRGLAYGDAVSVICREGTFRPKG